MIKDIEIIERTGENGRIMHFKYKNKEECWPSN